MLILYFFIILLKEVEERSFSFKDFQMNLLSYHLINGNLEGYYYQLASGIVCFLHTSFLSAIFSTQVQSNILHFNIMYPQ